MSSPIHITELQYHILAAVQYATEHKLRYNGRDIYNFTNNIRKNFKMKRKPYPTVFENLTKLQKVRDFNKRKYVPFVKKIKNPKERGYWILTKDGKEWLNSIPDINFLP